MKPFRRWLPLLGLAILASCGGDADPRRGGAVVIGAGNDLDAANPLVSVDGWTNEILRFALFTPLIRLGEDLDYEPYLAESWEMMGDTAVVFRIRRDVSWHDGTPTTAEDVLFTFERAVDPATAFPNIGYFQHWTGGEVLDSFTVRFRFNPHAEPLAGWPSTPIAPRHLLGDIPPGELRQAPFNRNPVGNGPFVFVSQRPNDRWVFDSNPDFPDGLGGRPLIDRLVWRVIPDQTAQVTEIRVGGVDLVLQPRPDQVRALGEQENLNVVEKPSRQYAFVAWNGRRPPLDDARVRRALAMGIDRGRILRGLRGGLGAPAVAPIMPFHWSYDDSLDPLPHDPSGAAELLGLSGIRDRNGDGRLQKGDGSPFDLELKFPASSDFHRDVAEAIRADLARLGVRVTTRPTEITTLFADVTSPERRFDAALLGWSGDFRLDLRDTFHSEAMAGPYQFASYANAEVDALIERAATDPHRDSARPLWQRVQRVLRDEQPWTLLYYHSDAFLARDRLRGVRMDIRGALVNVTEWWVEAPPESARPADTGDAALPGS
jgi:peptide/nickel transport system substrate-binding protein